MGAIRVSATRVTAPGTVDLRGEAVSSLGPPAGQWVRTADGLESGDTTGLRAAPPACACH
jgi:hypothetical protein